MNVVKGSVTYFTSGIQTNHQYAHFLLAKQACFICVVRREER